MPATHEQDGVSHLRSTPQCFANIQDSSQEDVFDMFEKHVDCRSFGDQDVCNASGHCRWENDSQCKYNPNAARAVKILYPIVASNHGCALQTSEHACNNFGLYCAWDAAEERCGVDLHAIDGLQACQSLEDCPEMQRVVRLLQPLEPIVESLLVQSETCESLDGADACAQDEGCVFRDGACSATDTSIAQTVGLPITRVLPAANFSSENLSSFLDFLRLYPPSHGMDD